MIACQEHRSASLCFMVLFRKASLVHDTQFSIYLRPVSNRCSPFLGSFKGGQIQMPLTVQYHSEIRSSGGSVCGMLHSTIQWNSSYK